MKARRRASLLVALAFLPLACAAPQRTSEAPAAARPAVPRAWGPRRAPFDVEHYALDLELLPKARRIEGSATVRLVARSDLREVALDLVGLDVARVEDRRGRPLEFGHDGGVLVVRLGSEVPEGEPLEFTVHYGGVPQKGLHFVGDEAGVPTHVYTQGECEDARYWFPCWDEPDDRATSELAVTLPEEWVATAAGLRVEESAGPGWRRERWRMPHPHPSYLVTLVAGKLALQTDEWQGVPLSFLSPPELAPLVAASLEATPSALEFLSEITGRRYPYAKYSQACVENFLFGGMENISATTMTAACLRDERGLLDDDPDGLVLHEAAHQWFGDLLTCADWSHAWLNEGFASYVTLLWFERTLGTDEFRSRMRDMLESYLEGDRRSPRPIVYGVCEEPLDLFFSGHIYQGGATRLHLLRHVIGDAAFLAGLRSYVGRNAGRGSVVTEDIERAMSEAAGVDLTAFFDQWLRAPGHPRFDVRWRYDQPPGQLTLTVHQTQDVENGTPAAFQAPVDVEIRTSKGTELHRVQIERRQEQFRFALDERPIWVRFDKYRRVPGSVRAEKDLEEWLAILAMDDDVNGRRDAVDALEARFAEVAEADRARIEAALEETLASGPVSALRSRAASALGRLEGGREALEAAARRDAAAAVRVAALEALEAWGQDAVLAALAEEVFEQGYSWRTMGAAAGLRAEAAPEGAFEWVRERLAIASPHGELERRLLGVLGELADPRSAALLRSWMNDGEAPVEARAEAVRALADEAGRSEELRREMLALLASPLHSLRRRAVEVLAFTQDDAVRAALATHHARTLYPREQRAIEAGGVASGVTAAP